MFREQLPKPSLWYTVAWICVFVGLVATLISTNSLWLTITGFILVGGTALLALLNIDAAKKLHGKTKILCWALSLVLLFGIPSRMIVWFMLTVPGGAPSIVYIASSTFTLLWLLAYIPLWPMIKNDEVKKQSSPYMLRFGAAGVGVLWLAWIVVGGSVWPFLVVTLATYCAFSAWLWNKERQSTPSVVQKTSIMD